MIHQGLQPGSSLSGHRVAVALNSAAGETQDDARESRIRDNQIGAFADHRVCGAAGLGDRPALDEARLIASLHVHIRGPADSKARVPAQQSSRRDRYIGKVGQALDRFWSNGHLLVPY